MTKGICLGKRKRVLKKLGKSTDNTLSSLKTKL